MLANIQDVVKRTAALLDDPGQTEFDTDYLSPYINQIADAMDVDLEVLGLQYQEQIAIIPLSTPTSDLSPFMADGQPLAAMKLPNGVDWKLSSQPDTAYVPSVLVGHLPDVTPSSIGAYKFSWRGSVLYVTPSAVPVTVRIYFDAMSATLYDPADKVVRGVTHVIAYRAAAKVADLRGNPNMANSHRRDGDKAWHAFSTLAIMRNQKRSYVVRGQNNRRGSRVNILAADSGVSGDRY